MNVTLPVNSISAEIFVAMEACLILICNVCYGSRDCPVFHGYLLVTQMICEVLLWCVFYDSN